MAADQDRIWTPLPTPPFYGTDRCDGDRANGAGRDPAGGAGTWQLLAELSYEFIAKMISDNIGKEGKPYFSFIFTIFMFVLFGNFLGMLPYSFTFTSHIAVTLTMALVIFVLVTVIAFMKHGMHFFLLAGRRADLSGATNDRD